MIDGFEQFGYVLKKAYCTECRFAMKHNEFMTDKQELIKYVILRHTDYEVTGMCSRGTLVVIIDDALMIT